MTEPTVLQELRAASQRCAELRAALANPEDPLDFNTIRRTLTDYVETEKRRLELRGYLARSIRDPTELHRELREADKLAGH